MKKLTIFKPQSVICKLLSTIFLSVCIIFSICVYHSFADVPCMINYQGRLIKDNVPVHAPEGIKMVFTIYDSQGDNNDLWSSGEVYVPVHNGLFRYVIGSDGGDLSSIGWAAGQELWLEVKIDEETLSPREQIYAYPYAINSHFLEGHTTSHFLDVSGSTQTKKGGLNIMGNVGIGTMGTQVELDVNGKIKEYGNDLLPRGVIVMWSGTLATIPDGWALCDGGTYPAPDGTQVTTPDLRDKFIYGVTAGEDPGATGGSETHQHTVGIYKSDNISQGIALDWNWPYWTNGTPSGDEYHYAYVSQITRDKVMQTSPTSTLPPYYKLAFIMKL